MSKEMINAKAEEPMATDKSKTINSENAVFTKTEGGFIGMELDGKKYDRVKVIRLFPFTDPDKYMSVRDVMDGDKEIGIIEDISGLPEETVKILLEQQELYYFTPVITKVISIKDEYGYAYFDVETDKGRCKFTINMGADAVSKLSDTRLLITDVDGNRFEIANVLDFTVKEQRKLDLFL